MKDKIIDYIDLLEAKARQNDKYFEDRLKLHMSNQEKDKEIERLNNTINEIEAIIYNEQITGIEARIEIQERIEILRGEDNE